MAELVLASQSPRRLELLTGLGVRLRVVAAETDENQNPAEEPAQLALANGAEKVRAALPLVKGPAYLVGADTVVYCDRVLGKPETPEEACAMLTALSGRSHEVFTGLAVLEAASGRLVSEAVKTQVVFKPLTEQEIVSYVQTGEPMDKAGAYGIQGRGALFVEKIVGDYFNVVGLPLFTLEKLLKLHFNRSLLLDFK